MTARSVAALYDSTVQRRSVARCPLPGRASRVGPGCWATTQSALYAIRGVSFISSNDIRSGVGGARYTIQSVRVRVQYTVRYGTVRYGTVQRSTVLGIVRVGYSSSPRRFLVVVVVVVVRRTSCVVYSTRIAVMVMVMVIV